MSENQTLREALQAIANIDDATNHSVDASAALDRIGQIARQALALPTAEQVDDINVAESFTSVTKTAEPVGEREECAKWYAEKGWLLDEEDVPAAIRARGEAEPLTRYRVWPDGTVQEGSESPHAWMSDDFEYVDAVNEEQAALSAGAHGIDAAMRKDKT